MNGLVVCDSRAYGNTRKVAEAIAGALDAEVVTPQEARRTEIGDYDLNGFGSGIYAMNFYSDLRRFVEELPKVDGKKAFLFLTSASSERSMHKPVARLTAALADHGYEVVGHFWCRVYWGPWLLRLFGGVNKGHPDHADLVSARDLLADLRAATA
jgi:flavodoxin